MSRNSIGYKAYSIELKQYKKQDERNKYRLDKTLPPVGQASRLSIRLLAEIQ
ncbi:MAG: hypothetical protein U9N08_04905 [Candidatus Caldatribacteriota bacterium]|nr:hypothetical protein [Candidatus Caldatribacteriota bacterium]